jgi:hypothetical protein
MRRQNVFGLAAIMLLLFGGPAFAAEKSTATQLIELAKSNSPALKDAITKTLEAKELKDGTAWVGRGADFFFAIEAASSPSLVIDGASGPQMQNVSGSDFGTPPLASSPSEGCTPSITSSVARRTGRSSAAGWTCLCLVLCRISKPQFQRARFRRSFSTPAKSTMA